MSDYIHRILAKTLRPMAQQYLRNQAHAEIVDNKVETLQKQIEQMRLELNTLQGKHGTSEPTIVDAIYEEHKEELERDHMDEIVAFDIETKEIAGIGQSVREAYDNAKRKFNKEQFYLKRVGSKHLHRLK